MKVACLQEHLAKGLSTVRRAVASRSSLPILTHVLLIADQGRLSLSATNLELSVTYNVEAKIEEAGSITVPASLLSDFVNSLPSERVELTLDEDSRLLKLYCANFEATFNGLDPAEFPSLPSLNSTAEVIEVAPNILKQVINQVCFAAATDEGQPVLTGVLAQIGPDSLTLSATDIFRLAQKTVPLCNAINAEFELIIPARTLLELARVLSDSGSPTQMAVTTSQNQIIFQTEQATIVSQLLEGHFPDFSQVIPKQHTTRTIIDAPTFLKAAKVSHLFSRDAANTVKLDISPDQASTNNGLLVLTAISQEVGENVSELEANISGEPVEIAFNTRYLIDALSALDSPQVALETSAPTSPGLIYPVGDESVNYVICPMHLSR